MNERDQDRVPPPVLNVWALAGEVGIIITLPLVVFILIGIRIDRALNTTPLFIICALFLSLITSTIALYRKIKRLM